MSVTTADRNAEIHAAVQLVTPVGELEIAHRLGVEKGTVHQWQKRGLLPPRRWTISNMPAWDWFLDILPWAMETGRANY